MTTFFISDLHLCASRPQITRLFITFLDERLQPGDQLYILGDLFEAWIGDDALDDETRPVIEALQALHLREIKLYVMHGNRDFLLGKVFSEATCSELLDDPTIVELGAQRVMLMHGDTLCTDDVDYQAFRQQVRSDAFIDEFLNHSIEKRQAIASQFREESRNRSKEKSAEIMDVNQATVEAVMRQNHVSHLIHGHTHRPAQHQFKLDGVAVERTVLGDWYHQGSVLYYLDGVYTLESLSL